MLPRLGLATGLMGFRDALWEVDGAFVLGEQRDQRGAPLPSGGGARRGIRRAQVQRPVGPRQLHLQGRQQDAFQLVNPAWQPLQVILCLRAGTGFSIDAMNLPRRRHYETTKMQWRHAGIADAWFLVPLSNNACCPDKQSCMD